MNFGEKLKALRKANHITMDMMSVRSGFSKDELRKMESSSEVPDVTSVRRLAIALGVEKEELM